MNNEILNKQTAYNAKWLKLVDAEAKIRGEAKKWTYCTRRDPNEKPTQTADAVVIVPFVKTDAETRIILVREYRIPLEGYQIAFPAGLIDKGEDARTSAERELKEETGHRVVSVLGESPRLATSAGLTDETFQYIFVEAKPDGAQALETSEDIETLTCTLSELAELMNGSSTICGRTWPICFQYLQNHEFPL